MMKEPITWAHFSLTPPPTKFYRDFGKFTTVLWWRVMPDAGRSSLFSKELYEELIFPTLTLEGPVIVIARDRC